MQVVPELQRLLSVGPGGLPERCVVDCAAIERWRFEQAPTEDIWPIFFEVAARTKRTLLWLVGPTAASHAATTPELLDVIHDRLVKTFGTSSVQRTQAPVSFVLATGPWTTTMGLITAQLEERPYELFPLVGRIDAALDVSTGRVWTLDGADEAMGSLLREPLRSALLKAEPGKKAVAQRAVRYQDELREVFEKYPNYREGLIHSGLPRTVKDAIVAALPEAEALAGQLSGAVPADDETLQFLNQFSACTCISTGQPQSLYVAASFDSSGRATAISVRGALHDDVAEWRCSKFLSELALRTQGVRWYVPRALELLSYMASHKMALPSHVVDPALSSFVLDPDEPPALLSIVPAIYGLHVRARRSLDDVRREGPPFVPEDVSDVADVLEDVDRTLGGRLQQEQLQKLIEEDLAPTLPILGSIEQEGLLVLADASVWQTIRQNHIDALQPALRKASKFLRGADPLRCSTEEVLEAVQRICGQLPSDQYLESMEAKDKLARYAAIGCKAAEELQQIRNLLSEQGVLRWIALLADGGGALRGVLRPTKTGRFTYHDQALHSLPREGDEAFHLRSLVVPPPGTVLISADWNAFEPRLLGALTGAPLLLSAASQPSDFYELFAKSLKVSRAQAKSVINGVVNGISADGFAIGATSLSIPDAKKLHQDLLKLVPAFRRYRRDIRLKLRTTGVVRSPGGWQRRLSNKGSAKQISQGVNLTVQGFAADIMRWVLRRLSATLPSYDARIIFQQHDEVVVACPQAAAQDVRTLLETTMNQDVVAHSGLLHHQIALPVKVKPTTRIFARDWGELL